MPAGVGMGGGSDVKKPQQPLEKDEYTEQGFITGYLCLSSSRLITTTHDKKEKKRDRGYR